MAQPPTGFHELACNASVSTAVQTTFMPLKPLLKSPPSWKAKCRPGAKDVLVRTDERPIWGRADRIEAAGNSAAGMGRRLLLIVLEVRGAGGR